jgi:hypothetical protein
VRALWDDLAGRDADRAFTAVGLLAASPPQAVPLLRDRLRPALDLETRLRVEDVLAQVETSAADPENLRVLRAVEVLEHAGTPEARRVLQTLAGGAPEARRTRAAAEALRRLRRRPDVTP